MAQKSKNEGIHYTVTGTGPTILLLPGLGLSEIIFDELRSRLEKSFTTVALDIPGSGKSTFIDEHATIETIAMNIAHLLIEESIAPAGIIGHSMGGFVTLQMALDYPRLASRAVLLSTSANGSKTYFPFIERGSAIQVVRENFRLSTSPSFPTRDPVTFAKVAERTAATLGRAQ